MAVVRWTLAVLGLGASLFGCSKSAPSTDTERATASAEPALSSAAPPRLLYVPDASASPIVYGPAPLALPSANSNCPADMVSVRGLFCIDRFEASLVDKKQSRSLSPYFHPARAQTESTLSAWQNLRFTMGEPEFQILPVPAPPAFQLREQFTVKATSARGVVPNGYLSGLVAAEACANAGKRLCREQEWVTACRGERDQAFPYGESFEPGKCNVKNGHHPATILHGNAGIGHLDPRLNAFQFQGQSLLHVTGSDPECVSRWGNDGVWGMVGNLDEWIDDDAGVFLGGFYARNTEVGCAARISVHPRAYYDYSLGVRCCL